MLRSHVVLVIIMHATCTELPAILLLGGQSRFFYQMSRTQLNHGNVPLFCTNTEQNCCEFCAKWCPTWMQLNAISELPFDFRRALQPVCYHIASLAWILEPNLFPRAVFLKQLAGHSSFLTLTRCVPLKKYQGWLVWHTPMVSHWYTCDLN